MTVDVPKVFFSYARADREFVLKLANDLRSAGVSLWIDQLDIPPGDRWDSAVEKALKASLCLVVVLSPASVASQNVLDEVAFALENNKKVVPVLHNRCAVPFRLQRLQYIDFTATYNHGLTQLVSALNVGQPSQTTQAPGLAVRAGVDASEPKPTSSGPWPVQFPLGRYVSTIHNHPYVLAIVFLFMIISSIEIFTGAFDSILPLPIKSERPTNLTQDQNTYFNSGVANMKEGRYDRAINDFSQVIASNQNYKEAYYNRGVCHIKIGDYDKAIRDFSEFIKRDSSRDGAYYNRGISFQKTGQNDRAIDDFKKVLEISKDTNLRQRSEDHLT
jgi:tetratricopeptide (TPR) repeat protein